MSSKPVLFISYAHADEPDEPDEGEIQWLSFVRSYLKPSEKAGIIEIWTDRLIVGGADLDPEIKKKLGVCDIFVLLVSTYSMSSDYIVDQEIAAIRERQKNGDDVHFYPIVIKPTPRDGIERVWDKNLRPRDAKPLSGFSPHKRMQHMTEAADEIAKLARRIAQDRTGPMAAVRVATPSRSHIDLNRLPETAYEHLVGRDAELARLDQAWTDERTSILSLVAEGGAGKSALVNEWLRRLQAESYRGAQGVLGWSFYSQGSRERATSAEEFLNWALERLGLAAPASATAKGEAIAEALGRRRVLLVLDGVEPLQHGPDGERGRLKDQGLRALLRHFAALAPGPGHGLIVLTSRLAVADIAGRRSGSAPVIHLERLSDEAGAALLRDNGVWGTERERKAASREFGGHALALGLLASFLKETQGGDLRRRDRIRAYLADGDNPGHGHARRVMESYEREWLAGQPVFLAVLHMVGLFDRPASGDCLNALRAEPAIEGLTDALIPRDDMTWQRAVARLRAVRLLAPADPAEPEALDAHPLVREWFGERLRQADPAAYRAAHGRLYEHLRDTTQESAEPTLAELGPLYQAIAHGCRAGRHQEALDTVYRERICRRRPDGELEFYTYKKLGAISSDLVAISWFFTKPYETPVSGLSAADQAWVFNEASFGLRAQGRSGEALPSLRATLQILEEADDRMHVAIAAYNLSQTECLIGEIFAAVVTAERAVAHADNGSDIFRMMCSRIVHADALHAIGQFEKAKILFDEAERIQRQREPEIPFLYSAQGYIYCDLILRQGDHATARQRGAQALKVSTENKWLLDIGFDTLTLGRAALASVLETARLNQSTEITGTDVLQVSAALEKSVEGLRAAGQSEYIPQSLLARAAFRRSLGDGVGATRDLDEAAEIAELGPMRLHLCDGALERARLAFARREAFAPLNGLLENGPLPPTPPDREEAARLTEEARKNLATARDLIARCGYHKRDAELAELEGVLAGKGRFADLPHRA